MKTEKWELEYKKEKKKYNLLLVPFILFALFVLYDFLAWFYNGEYTGATLFLTNISFPERGDNPFGSFTFSSFAIYAMSQTFIGSVPLGMMLTIRKKVLEKYEGLLYLRDKRE